MENGKFVIVPTPDEAFEISARFHGLVIVREADIRPCLRLMERGRHVVMPLTMAPRHFQLPIGTDALLSSHFHEGHGGRPEALRIAASAGRINFGETPRITVLPDTDAGLRFAAYDPGYVMRGPTDLDEVEKRLAARDHVILTPIEIPHRLCFAGAVSYRIMSGCPEDTEARVRGMGVSSHAMTSPVMDQLRRIVSAPTTFSFM